MVEFRWVLHDMKHGLPPKGSIFVGDRAYQILQTRIGVGSGLIGGKITWSDWKDVPFVCNPTHPKD